MGLLDRCGVILWEFLDVAEGGEVLEEFCAFLLAEGHGIHGWGIGAFPGLEVGQEFLWLEGVGEHAAGHFAGAWNPEPREDGGCDVGQARSMDHATLAETGSRGGEDAVGAVPDDDAGGHPRHKTRPQVVAVEAVVGNNQDARLGPCEIEKPCEQEVVEAVGAVHHIVVVGEVFFGSALHARRVEGHEEMRNLIDGAVVNHREVPILRLHQMRGGGVRIEGLGKAAGEFGEAGIFFLIDAGEVFHKHREDVATEFGGVQAQGREGLGEALGKKGSLRRRGPFNGRGGGFGRKRGVEVRNEADIRVALALRGEPSGEVGLEALQGEYVPHRAAPAGGGGDGQNAAVADFGETVDSMLGGMPARGDGGPQHRRERGLEGGEIAAGAIGEQLREHGHLTRAQERFDDFPIGGVPADNEQAAL